MKLSDTVFELIEYILGGLIIYGIFILIERLGPAEPNQPFKHILFNHKDQYSIWLAYKEIPLGLERYRKKRS